MVVISLMRGLNTCFKSSMKKFTSLSQNAAPSKNMLSLMISMMINQYFNIMPNTFHDIDQPKLIIQLLKGHGHNLCYKIDLFLMFKILYLDF